MLEWSTPGLHVVQEPEFYDINIVLDSGAADHVADSSDAPGYKVSEGPGSKAGGCFVAANGEPIASKGEMTLEMQSGDAAISAKFQVAKISRPLWSVGKI